MLEPKWVEIHIQEFEIFWTSFGSIWGFATVAGWDYALTSYEPNNYYQLTGSSILEGRVIGLRLSRDYLEEIKRVQENQNDSAFPIISFKALMTFL